MKPIPKSLLIHTATMVTEYAKDKWGEAQESESCAITSIRIEPCRVNTRDKSLQDIVLTATLFFDCKSSACDMPFLLEGEVDDNGREAVAQRVRFNGRDYTVKTIEPIYDNKKLHHYEVGLSG